MATIVGVFDRVTDVVRGIDDERSDDRGSDVVGATVVSKSGHEYRMSKSVLLTVIIVRIAQQF